MNHDNESSQRIGKIGSVPVSSIRQPNMSKRTPVNPQQLQSPAGQGSHFGQSQSGSAMFQFGNQNSQINRQDPSNLQELSQSILNTPGLQQNFLKNRSWLDPARLLNAPQFSGIKQSANSIDPSYSQTPLINGGEFSSNTQVLWGTNINTNDLSNKMKDFLLSFQPEQSFNPDVQMSDNQDDLARYGSDPHYVTLIKQMHETEQNILEIDCQHLFTFNEALYRQLEDYPTDVLPIFDLMATEVYRQIIGTGRGHEDVHMRPEGVGSEIIPPSLLQDIEQQDIIIQVRPHNMRRVFQIRELDPAHIDKLITLKGIVIRTSDTVPEMKEATFRCVQCMREESRFVERGRIAEPDHCEKCKKARTFEIVHNYCQFTDKQHVKLQETPETVPEGETPQTIQLQAFEMDVDFVKPGDRIELVGIYRAVGNRVNSSQRTLKNIYKTFIDVITYVKTDKKRYNDNENQAPEGLEEQDDALCNDHEGGYTPEQIRSFHEIGQSPQIYDILIDALAPSIWENQDVKKGILCQLFGGVTKIFQGTGKGRLRGEINILLCGDPSTAKSQLLQYVHKIAPRGIYTSGKGSSAVGLTVYVTKDPETKEIILESGALVLSDRGICCIDEFDKMDDNTRVILHEAMEQQTVSVAKAGIICQLNARTAILAAANPVHSKYDPKLSVVDNIKLPPTLLSRFDLIYLILDKQSEASDRRLANHIVSLYSNFKDPTRSTEDEQRIQRRDLLRSHKIDREFFAQYISYARRFVKPQLSEDISRNLVAEYMKMRALGNTTKTVTATPRQLESMIRLAEALAKMRLSQIVEKKDVDESVRLIKFALQQSATDPTTGKINMDIITTGQTKTSADRLEKLCEFIKSVYKQFQAKIEKNGLKYINLYDFMHQKAKEGVFQIGQESNIFTEKEFRDALNVLEDEGVTTLIGHTSAPTIRFNNLLL